MLKRANIGGDIKATLTVKGQGEETKFDVTYFNRRQSELEAALKKALEDDGGGIPNVVLFMVKDWDTEYPLTLEGIKELEDERPGILYGIIAGFHAARKVEAVKN